MERKARVVPGRPDSDFRSLAFARRKAPTRVSGRGLFPEARLLIQNERDVCASDTPLGYLTAWRMTLAARRFEGGKPPLGVVASEVGYQSEAAFSRAFRKYHDAPPSKYRITAGA